MEYHSPALLQESLEGLNIKGDGVYVDITFGGGGHSKAILGRLGSAGRLFAFDQDEDAMANAMDDPRFTLIQQNFRFAKRFLRFYGIKEVDGVLGDLGVSSHQFDTGSRGFSTRFDAKLDMRMDQEDPLSAYEVVNTYEEEQLKDVLMQYGELRNAKAIAATLVAARPIETTAQLKETLHRFVPRHREHKISAQVFQAIRIEVNQELEVLKEFLLQTPALLKKGGRLCMISYHSLEDRLVKLFIRDGGFDGAPEKDLYGRMDLPFKKIGKLVTPSEEEVVRNPRVRSAKLRIGERT